MRTTGAGPSPTSRVRHGSYALIVGISKYASGIPRLQYAAKDARDIYDLLLGEGVSPDNMKLLLDAQQRVSAGMVIIAAGDADRKSLETSSWQNGMLTHVALKALRGQADGYMGQGPKDGRITLGELKVYVQAELPKITSDLGMAACFPVIATLKGDVTLNDLPMTRIR